MYEVCDDCWCIKIVVLSNLNFHLFLLNFRGDVTGHMFYNRFGQQGLIDGYWAIETYPLNVKSGYEYIHTMQKSIFKKLNLKNDCMKDTDDRLKNNYNYLECIENYSVALLQKTLKEKGHKLCWIPHADYFIRLMNISNIEACQSTQEMENLNRALQFTMDKSRKKDSGSGCIRPCTVPIIMTKVVQNMVPNLRDDPKATNTYIYLQWENDQILTEEEYLLMDTSEILSNIGGSLGLFLGFSCLQFMGQILNKLETFITKLNH